MHRTGRKEDARGRRRVKVSSHRQSAIAEEAGAGGRRGGVAGTRDNYCGYCGGDGGKYPTPPPLRPPQRRYP